MSNWSTRCQAKASGWQLHADSKRRWNRGEKALKSPRETGKRKHVKNNQLRKMINEKPLFILKSVAEITLDNPSSSEEMEEIRNFAHILYLLQPQVWQIIRKFNCVLALTNRQTSMNILSDLYPTYFSSFGPWNIGNIARKITSHGMKVTAKTELWRKVFGQE